MTSATGYQAVRFSDAIFYKTPHLSGSRWDTANQYNVERTYALLSRRLSNWSYASSRIFVSPFAWVDAGATEFERARSPDQVAEQLDAFRTWATGGEFLNYAQGLGTFDYRPYRKALVEASTPARVDTVAPTLMVGEVTRDGSTVKIAGSARDNLGVRAVHWSEVGGAAAGAAPMTWTTISGDRRSGWDWQMDWSFDGIEVPPGTAAIAITVEDIKGLTTTVNVPVPD